MLQKTEVLSPVKLSLRRKNSRKITWKQVQDVLNSDDIDLSKLTESKDLSPESRVANSPASQNQ